MVMHFNAPVFWLSICFATVSTTSYCESLPDDEGREAVEAQCSSCHSVNRITQSLGYSREGWLELAATMVDLSADPVRRDVIADYLAEHFPPNDRRAPTIADGDTRISFKEWVVPTLGQRSRDPHTAVFDSGGILWFTLQHANRIGRLDPRSGRIKLVTMPTAGSRPYGIKIDASGTPWVACNGSNCLVQVDPKTMALTEIDLPHQGTTVRRLDIAADGMIWYVNSGRGRVGRYDPRSGEVREWPSPSGPRSHPYAIAVVDGAVWYNESGMRPDPLVRFDPKTETFQSWPIPSGGIYAGIVRHMRPTRDGDLLIHQSATNRIIRVEIGD